MKIILACHNFLVRFVLGKLIWTITRYLLILILGNNIFTSLFDVSFNNDFIKESYYNIYNYISEYFIKVRRIIAGDTDILASHNLKDRVNQGQNKFSDKDIELLAKARNLKKIAT